MNKEYKNSLWWRGVRLTPSVYSCSNQREHDATQSICANQWMIMLCLYHGRTTVLVPYRICVIYVIPSEDARTEYESKKSEWKNHGIPRRSKGHFIASDHFIFVTLSFFFSVPHNRFSKTVWACPVARCLAVTPCSETQAPSTKEQQMPKMRLR